MRLEPTRVDLLVSVANHYTTRGAQRRRSVFFLDMTMTKQFCYNYFSVKKSLFYFILFYFLFYFILFYFIFLRKFNIYSSFGEFQ